METNSPIRVGSRIYLANCIAGEPGVVTRFDGSGKAVVFWPDMPELARETTHNLESLILDEAFTVRQLDLFNEIAA